MSVRPASLLLAIALGALCAGPAAARSNDRSQPMDIEAGHSVGALDDSQPTVLSGGVKIVQGSLHVDADRGVITLSGGDPVRAVLTGGPVVLRQQMDDGTPMTARAANVDYDLRSENVVFSGNVEIQQPRGTLTGQRVTYNLKSGQVDSGGEGNGRVKMRILPKSARTQN